MRSMSWMRAFLFIWLTCASMMWSSFAVAQTRILMVGDSLTQGYGLPQGEGFVPQLELWLADKGHDVSLINAGVSGDTTAGGAERIDWLLTPDITHVVVALGGNDVLRGIDPQASLENLRKLLSSIQTRELGIMLVGISAPKNYGQAYQDDFDAIYPMLANEFDTILVSNIMKPIMARTQLGESVFEYIQSDGLHPNPKGVALIVEHIGPSILELIKS